MGRGSNSRGAVDGVSRLTYAVEFRIFDALPAVVRRALMYAPVGASALAVADGVSQLRHAGRLISPEGVVAMLNAEFDGEVVAFGAAYEAEFGRPYPGLASGVPRLGGPSCRPA